MEGVSKKRKRGEGTIRQHTSGSWEARLTMGEGRNRAPVSRYAKTKEEAENLLANMIEIEKKKGTPYRRSTSIYFIQAGGPTGAIKIGSAHNVQERLKTMQIGSAEQLKILLTIPNAGKAMERHLHKVFKPYRIHGEWFTPARELLHFIYPARKEKW